jgi:hypothetical protein
MYPLIVGGIAVNALRPLCSQKANDVHWVKR